MAPPASVANNNFNQFGISNSHCCSEDVNRARRLLVSYENIALGCAHHNPGWISRTCFARIPPDCAVECLFEKPRSSSRRTAAASEDSQGQHSSYHREAIIMGTTAKPTTPSAGGKPAQNPLKDLIKFGQSVWLDYIRRDLLTTGELKRLIEVDGLRGMTSNPSIFEKAITGSNEYTSTLQELEKRKDLDAKGRYEELAIKDIQDAADFLRPVYQQTKKRDGYVSLEVSPYLAHKTQETLDEARRLWKRVGRENLMVKVPGTPEGIPAFQQLISEGININVTLLFAFDVYVRVAEAYIAGLEAFAKGGGDVSRMASVASFFISRIDTLVDGEIDAKLKTATNPADQALLRSLHGKVAIANGKLTPRAALRPNASCGPAPAPKILSTAMFITSKN